MTQPRLMVVDDDPRVLRLVARLAQGQGFNVKTLDNPFLVKDEIGAFQPDILILDLVMRDCDGVEVMQVLAGEGWHGHILLLSGTDQVILKMATQLALHNGLKVAAAVQKPFENEDLVRELKALCNPEQKQPPGEPGPALPEGSAML